MSFYPCWIYNDIIENRRYFVGLSDSGGEWELNFYPVDLAKISSEKDVKLNDIYPAKILRHVPDMLNDIWGHQSIPFSEKRMNIRAIIHDNSCLNKIAADISSYKNTLIPQNDETNLMELENILGYKGFITWVLRFGSSIEVLEPKRLREDIRAIYIKVLEKYMDEESP